MIICRVVGNVISSKTAGGVEGASHLLVQPSDPSGKVGGTPMVAVDAVQSGVGDLVMVAQGSSCRQIGTTKERAVDALIIGIIDLVDEDGLLRYRKGSE